MGAFYFGTFSSFGESVLNQPKAANNKALWTRAAVGRNYLYTFANERKVARHATGDWGELDLTHDLVAAQRFRENRLLSERSRT